jgi:hypothetical protein
MFRLYGPDLVMPVELEDGGTGKHLEQSLSQGRNNRADLGRLDQVVLAGSHLVQLPKLEQAKAAACISNKNPDGYF